MVYEKLVTRSINQKLIKQNISKSDIVNILKLCYSNIAFSTFPYLVYSRSNEAVSKMNSGNCIALSMYLQTILKTKMNIVSFLIPVTVPQVYQVPGLLTISHVALAIPISPTKVYIADPAFYFLEPILVDLTKSKNKPIASINIHDNIILMVESINKKTDKKLDLNEYQSIPRNTHYCECNYDIDPNDKWSYFLREIVNPDKTIGKSFLQIKNQPWITVTELDEVGKCRKHLNLKIKPHGNVEIKLYNQIYHDGPISALLEPTINYLNQILAPYFGGDVRQFLNRYIVP